MQAYQRSAAVLFVALFSSACAPPGYAPRGSQAVAPAAPGPRAVVIVRIPMPWYAPRFVVRGKFRDVLPEYEPLGPLDAKYFSISDDREYGGVYVWKTRADVERHFDAAWRAGVRERRGVDASVLVMDAPYVIEGGAVPLGKPMGARSLEYPAWISFVHWTLPEGADVDANAKALSTRQWPSEALIRAFIVTEPRAVGVIALWATRDPAERSASEEARSSIGKELGASRSGSTIFEAPLLVDGTLRAQSDLRYSTKASLSDDGRSVP